MKSNLLIVGDKFINLCQNDLQKRERERESHKLSIYAREVTLVLKV